MNITPSENDAVRGRVLLVENASVFREMQSLLLRQAGYEVVTCDTPESALAECARQAFDVALLNSDAAGIDSAEFLTQLRHPAPGPSVLFVAAVLTVELTRVLTRSGVNAVMQRPVDVKSLIGKIDELVGAAAPLPASRYLAAPPAIESVPVFQSEPATPAGIVAPAERANQNSVLDSTSGSRPGNSIPPFPTNSASPFGFGSTPPFRYSSASPFRVESAATPFRAETYSGFGSVLHR